MKYKKGDKVILNLHTKCGDCCIPERDHNKEFIIIEAYHPFRLHGIWDYLIKDKRDYTWCVKEPMLSLYNPQMLFSFMYE